MAFGRNKKEKKSKKKDKAAGVAQEPELIIGEVQTPKTVGATMLEKGVPTLKDMMAPPSFDRTEFDHLGIGDRVMRSFLLSGFPKHIMVGWADKLYNYDGDLDMTIHINPMDEREAIDELTDKITQYEAQLDVESEKGQTRNMTRLGNQITELVREREKIEQNYISMFQVQMICNLYGKTVDQLDKETQMLDNTLRGKKIKLMPLHLRQDQGYKSGMPFGKTWLPKNFRNFSSEGLTACFPFYNAEISHPSGTLLGVNLQTQTPIYVDFFDRRILENGNTTVLGRAGSGKTFLVSLLTMRSALQSVRTVIIDPEGEYSTITEALGGKVIKIAPGSTTIPNPFDLEDEEVLDEDGQATGQRIVNIKEKVADLLNLIGVMTGELTQEQRSLVSFALASIYEEFGFTEDYTSLYDNDVVMNDRGEFVHHGHKRPMPTFSDFHRKLEEIAQTPGNETLVSVANALRMFKRDGVYGLFDQPTSEDMTNYTDAPVICFDIKQLEENVLRPIGMYNALSWAWEKFAKKNPKLRKRIVCDEAWMLTNPNMPGFQFTAQFLETCSRRSRKRNCCLLVASQNFKEFVSCPQGEAVLSNAVVNIFLKQSSTDLDAVQEKFKLSNGERAYLTSPARGHFLLKMNSEATIGYAFPMDIEKYLIEKRTIAGRK